jgi:hypothetical protein
VLLCWTIAFTFLWERFVADTLYNCTDPGWFDYLFPGDWAHKPVSVRHVTGGRSMSEPDTIKEGWTMTRLWYLWFSVVGISVILSALLAWMPWIPKRWVC